MNILCKGQVTGRWLLGLFLVVMGILKIIGFAGTAGYITAVLGVSGWMAQAGVVLAIIFELGGGLAILAGKHLQKVAGAVALYLAVTTLLFHLDLGDQMQLTQFLKNIGIIGGLLLLCDCKDCHDGECCGSCK